MASPVRTVVFDIGGVLLDWDPRYLYRRLIPDEGDLERFLSEICTPEWNSTLDAGRPFDQACDELARRHPDAADLVWAWKRQDEMVAGEIPGTATQVDELHAKGVPMYLLTNMPVEVFEARRERFRVLQRFDGAVVSGEEGVLKPSSEIFRRLVDRYALEPAQCLFIDDSDENVQAAADTGFLVHRFVDAPSLASRLRAYQLRP